MRIDISGNERQTEFYHAFNNARQTGGVILFSSGTGGGKTFIGSLCAAVMACAETPTKEQGFVLAPTYEKIQDVEYPALADLFEKIYGEGVVKYHKTHHFFTLPNGNQIYLRSADKPERIVGNNYAWCWLDEPGTMKEDVWDRLLGRLRGSKHPVVLLTGTPEGLNWVYDKIVKPTADGKKGYEKYRVIYGSSYDNKANLPDDYFAFLETLQPQLKAAWVGGQFVDFNSLQAYDKFSREAHVVPRLAYDPALPLILTVDFNIDPLSWVLLQDNRGVVQVFDNATLSMPNTRTPEGCAKVALILQALRYEGTLSVYGDLSGYSGHTSSMSTDYDIIKKLLPNVQVLVRPAHPAVRDRLNSVNSLFYANRVRISAVGNQKLIDDFVRVRLSDESGQGIDKKSKDLTHLSDAFGYFVFAKYPVTLRTLNARAY